MNQTRLSFAPSSAAKPVEGRGSEEDKGSSAVKPEEEQGTLLPSLDDSGEKGSSAGKPDEEKGTVLESLGEVQAWLTTCTEYMLTETSPLKRLKTAVDVCTLPSTRERCTEVRKLCGPQGCDVQQKVRGVKRNAEQLHTALMEKVVTEGHVWIENALHVAASPKNIG